jgi:adenine phosphoribosyltransferase
MESERAEKIKAASIRYEHFPKQGVTFIDIFPIISEPKVFSMVLDAFEERLKGVEFNKLFMLESKGFLFGPALSVRVEKPCYPIRKKGKLPGICEELAYALEYGNDVIEVQRHLLQPGDKVVLIDDVLATGGTLNAAIKLVQ